VFASICELPTKWRQKANGHASPPHTADTGGDTIIEGNRNAALTRLAGKLHNAGLSPTSIKAALAAENQACCKPPLDDVEIAKIVASVTRYTASLIPPGEDKAEFVMRQVLDRHYAGGDHLINAVDQQFWTFDGAKWAIAPRNVLERLVLEILEGLKLPGTHSTASLMKQVLTLLASKVAVGDDRLVF
jgi:hypothetical protein